MRKFEQSPSVQKDFFREQAVIIQSSMAFKPTEGKDLRYPLRYLLREPSSAKKLELTANEDEISQIVREFEEGDGSKLVKKLLDAISGVSTPKPYLITGQAGSGKSIFLGKLFARLTEKMEAEDDEIPRWLLFSQLKGLGTIEGLFNLIKEGFPSEELKESKAITDIKSVCKRVGIEPGRRGIILIDSLDEVPEKYGCEWIDLSKEMIDCGLIPVWTCREYNYEKSNLKPKSHKEIYREKIKHLKRISLEEEVLEELELLNSEKEWLAFSIPMNPLVLHHQTNFTIHADARKMLHLQVLRMTIDRFRQISHSNVFDKCKILKNERKPIDFSRELYCKTFTDPILYDILCEQIVLYTVENVQFQNTFRVSSDQNPYHADMKFEDALLNHFVDIGKTDLYQGAYPGNGAPSLTPEGREEYDEIQQEFRLNWRENYSEKPLPGSMPVEVSRKMKRSKMNTLLYEIGKEMLSRWKSTSNIGIERINSRLLDNEPEFRQFFLKLGFVRKDSNNDYHFSHRAFAEYVYWKYYQENNSEVNQYRKQFEDNQELFNWRKVNTNSFKHGNLDSYQGLTARNYLQRTGCFIVFIPSIEKILNEHLEDEIVQPWEYCVLTTGYPGHRQKWLKREISEEQKSSLIEQIGRPVLLGGWPGTGKTYAGTELLLNHTVRGEAGKHRSLVVTLNPQLSSSIRTDIRSRHADSIELQGTEMSIGEVMENVFCLSIAEMIEIYAPDFPSIIDVKMLRDEFERRPKLEPDMAWRAALADYQQVMFSDDTAKLVPLERYLGDKKSRFPIINSESAEKWYERVEILQHKYLALPRACRLLMNRLRYYERSVSPESVLEILPEENNIYDAKYPAAREERLKTLREGIDNGKLPLYHTVLIDEIQDLNPHAVMLISFLSQNRQKPHNIIMVGDEHQSLNSDGFNWEDFIKRIKYMTLSILKDIPEEKGIRFNHHLKHFLDIESPKKLSENHRNRSSIVETFVAGVSWPNSDYKMKGIDDIVKPETFSSETEGLVKVVQEPPDRYLETINLIIDLIRSRAGIALIVTDEVIRKYLDETVQSTEWFSPFDIKGLERPTVIVIGGWMVSPQGDYRHHFSTQRMDYENPSQDVIDEIDQMNNTMLVALSRAQENMLILLPSETINFKKYGLLNKQLKPPEEILSRIGELGDFFSRIQGPTTTTTGIIALMELLQFHDRSLNDPDLHNMKDKILTRVKGLLSASSNDHEGAGDDSILGIMLKEIEGYEGTFGVSPMMASFGIGLVADNNSEWDILELNLKSIDVPENMTRIFAAFSFYEMVFNMNQRLIDVCSEQDEIMNRKIRSKAIDYITGNETKRAISIFFDKVKERLRIVLNTSGIIVEIEKLLDEAEFLLSQLSDNLSNNVLESAQNNLLFKEKDEIFKFIEIFSSYENWEIHNNQGPQNNLHKISAIIVHFINETFATQGKIPHRYKQYFIDFVENLSFSTNEYTTRASFYSIPYLSTSWLRKELDLMIQYLFIEPSLHDDQAFGKVVSHFDSELIAELFHRSEYGDVVNRILNHCSVGHNIVLVENTIDDLDRERFDKLVEKVIGQLFSQLFDNLRYSEKRKGKNDSKWENEWLHELLEPIEEELPIALYFDEGGNKFDYSSSLERGIEVVIKHLEKPESFEIPPGFFADEQIQDLMSNPERTQGAPKIMQTLLRLHILMISVLLLHEKVKPHPNELAVSVWLSERSSDYEQLLDDCLSEREFKENEFNWFHNRMRSFIESRSNDKELMESELNPMLHWWSAMNCLHVPGPDLTNLAKSYPGLSILNVSNETNAELMQSISALRKEHIVDIEHDSIPINRLQELLRDLCLDRRSNPLLLRTNESFWDLKHPEFSFFKLTNSQWLDIALSYNKKRDENKIVLSNNKEELLDVVKRFYSTLFTSIKSKVDTIVKEADGEFLHKKSITVPTIRKSLINEFKNQVDSVMREITGIEDPSNVNASDKKHFKDEVKKLGKGDCGYEFVISPKGIFGRTYGKRDSFIKNELRRLGFIIDSNKEQIVLIENDIIIQPFDEIEENLNKILGISET